MLACALLLISLAASAVAQSIDAPAQVNAGSEVTISWSGDAGERDFITIVPVDFPEGRYKAYKYLKYGSPMKLFAPDAGGDYQVRWLSGASRYPTVVSRPIKVLPVSATLEGPSTVDLGAAFEVNWTGPNNQRDFITVVEKGTPEKKYGPYVYAKNGSPAKLKAPEKPGEYEVRYLSGQEYLTLGKHSFTIGGIEVSLEAPDRAGAGEPLEIAWVGPDNQGDFLTIVEKGAPERKYKNYIYTNRGNPAKLPAPEVAGEYEIRYLSGQRYLTLASRPLIVGAVSASVDGPDQVEGGRVLFEVSWTGPDNPGDYITITEKGAREGAYAEYEYTRKGNPLKLRSPLTEGDYELRYSTAREHHTLASKPIRVGPPATLPGKLRVVAESSSTSAPASGGAIEVILDASGSMLQRVGAQRRIEIARKTLTKLTQETIPAGTPFALRVFGHKEAGACRTDIEIPAGPLDPATAALKIGSIQAMNLAKTPIADSLAKVRQDLGSHSGEKVVVLVTDGEETCGGDPAAAVEALRASGVDVRVNIVGFAIDDEALKGQFRYWAELGGGGYFDAADATQLSASLSQAVQAPFEVLNAAGEVVAEGVAGGPAVELPAGTYTVRTSSKDVSAQVTAGSTATVAID